MNLSIRACYNLDLLNTLNVLTGNSVLKEHHPDLYTEFGEPLSDEGRATLAMISKGLGTDLISPLVAFGISFVDGFEEADLSALLLDKERILADLQRKEPRLMSQSEQLISLFQLIAPVIAELENMGFSEYWKEERLPLIWEKKAGLDAFIKKSSLEEEITALMGADSTPQEITLYVCTYAAPYGIKISGPRYIADVSYPKEIIFRTALHEMFHEILQIESLRSTMDAVAVDPFIKLAFEKKDPKYGYPEMEGFLEENIVEALTLYVCQQVGLEADPYGYLQDHDGGSHIFSVILLDALQRSQKDAGQPISEYLDQLIAHMPLGKLAATYQTAMQNAGKTIT